MRTWHTFALSAALVVGCSSSYTPEDEPIGGEGVCCPIADFSGCSPGFDPLPAGGWAPRRSACVATIQGFDGLPYVRRNDSRGCPTLVEDRSAPWCGAVPDAGPFPIDGGPFFPDVGPPPVDAGTPCDGLGLTTCLDTPGCTPRWDDACCPSCFEPGEPVACADCFRPTFHDCETTDIACSLVGISCGIVPSEYCTGGVVDCAGANPTSLDACDRYGCIPAFPSGEGEPRFEEAVCVPVVAGTCRTACRRLPPTCPSGTVPEGDGFCYTDRCVATEICAP
jgi:hypothetical protein